MQLHGAASPAVIAAGPAPTAPPGWPSAELAAVESGGGLTVYTQAVALRGGPQVPKEVELQ